MGLAAVEAVVQSAGGQPGNPRKAPGLSRYLRGMEISDNEGFEEAGRRLREMVYRGEEDQALAFAEDLHGIDTAVLQLRAWVAAEVGGERDDLELLTRAREMWAEASKALPDIPQFLYNEGSTAESAFRAVMRTKGHAAALETAREDLDFARETYLAVGEDERADEGLRLQALTNLANSFDTLGRDLEAIEAYDKALAIDSGYGMALGSKGMALAHVSHLADGHSAAVLSQAVEALDAALADREGVIAHGGPNAYETFVRVRSAIQVSDGGVEEHEHREGHVFGAHSEPWKDPYLEWCRREKLFSTSRWAASAKMTSTSIHSSSIA
jgi:tetratricopeptide (TPR) repeat protein